VRLANESLELSDNQMIRKAHPGVREIGHRLAINRTPFTKDLQWHACQRETARRVEEKLELCPCAPSPADEIMNEHGLPLAQRVISIRTPENIELSYALAGPGSRAAAYVLDLLVMSFVCQLMANLLIVAGAAILTALGQETPLWITAILGLSGFAVYNGYFILLEWLWNGQTPGKRLLHIRVIKQGGYALRFFDTLLRNLLRVIDFLPLFYGVGLTSLLLTRDSQRVGDLVAGTLVVYQEPVETESLLSDLAAPEEAEPALAADKLAALPHETISLAGEYLRARTELAPRARQEIAAELVELVRETSGLEPRPAQGVESFLTSIVRQSAQGLPLSFQLPVRAERPS
jgi:uncharacterized RDD family membrane protein YckC